MHSLTRCESLSNPYCTTSSTHPPCRDPGFRSLSRRRHNLPFPPPRQRASRSVGGGFICAGAERKRGRRETPVGRRAGGREVASGEQGAGSSRRVVENDPGSVSVRMQRDAARMTVSVAEKLVTQREARRAECRAAGRSPVEWCSSGGLTVVRAAYQATRCVWRGRPRVRARRRKVGTGTRRWRQRSPVWRTGSCTPCIGYAGGGLAVGAFRRNVRGGRAVTSWRRCRCRCRRRRRRGGRGDVGWGPRRHRRRRRGAAAVVVAGAGPVAQWILHQGRAAQPVDGPPRGPRCFAAFGRARDGEDPRDCVAVLIGDPPDNRGHASQGQHSRPTLSVTPPKLASGNCVSAENLFTTRFSRPPRLPPPATSPSP